MSRPPSGLKPETQNSPPVVRVKNRSIGRVVVIGVIARVLVLAGSPRAIAQATGVSEPAQLMEARARYEEEIAAAIKPIRDRYLKELERLETTAYYARDFDLACAVTREIASMGGTGGAAVEGNGSPEDNIKARLVNTAWIWRGGETITFLADGKARWSHTGAEAFTWKVAAAKPAVIVGTAWDGGQYSITLDGDLRTGKLFEWPLQERPTSQLEFK